MCPHDRTAARAPLVLAAALAALSSSARAGEIRGRILVGGLAVPGVTVLAVPYEAPTEEARRVARRGEPPRALATTATGADGSFTLATPAAAGLGFRLQAQGGGVAPAWLGGTFDSSEVEDLGDHALRRAQSVAGRVLNAGGAPVAGAEVTVIAPSSGAGADPDVVSVARTATTGADGAFRCDEAAASGNRIVVEAKGYGAESLANVASGAIPRPIRLGTGVALAGVVLRADRRSPAAGALVRFESGGFVTRWVEAGADGRFRLADLPPRAGRVAADGGDAGIGDVAAGSPPPAALTVVLAPAASLAGTVVDAGGRAAVPRARIAADDGRRTLLARAGPDGRYTLRGLAPSRAYRLTVGAPLYAPFERGGVVLSTGESRRLDVPLRRSASMSGRVVDETGAPVAGAIGRLVSRGDGSLADRLRQARGGGRLVFRSGADGGFTAAGLAPGEDQRLSVLHPDYEPRIVAGLSLAPGAGRSGLVVVLRRGRRVAGVVRDEAGRPVAGAQIDMLPLRRFGGRGAAGFGGAFAGADDPRPRASSGADGRFEVKGLAEGDYSLSASREGYADQSVEPVRVGADGASPIEVKLAAGASIRGTVVNADRSGAAGYAVRAVAPGSRPFGPFGGAASLPSATTADDGSFSIGGLRAGETYDLVTLARGRPGPRREGVDAPADGVEIVLPSSGRISGRILDAQTQSPVTDFLVAFEPDRSSGGRGFGPGGGRGGPGFAGLIAAIGGRDDRQAIHGDDGTFVLEGVPAGTWELVARAEGYQTARIGGIALEEGGRSDGVEVRLRRGASIQGQVLDASTGQPILDAAITLRRPGGPAGPGAALGAVFDDADARTDGDGRFSVGGLGAGSYTVVARHPDYADGSALVDVKDAPVTADLRLTAGGSMAGMVLSEAGAALPGATVTLGAGGGAGGFGRFGALLGGQTTMTDEAGRFRFTHVTAGRYAVAASAGSRQTAPLDLVLQAGEARDNLLLSLAAGARIHGIVTGLPAALRSSVTVSASGPGGYFSSARAGADGTFELTGAPPGPVSLRATAADASGAMRSATSQVSVADGQADVEADIAFEAGFTLQGTVTRASQPVAGAIVGASLEGGGGRTASARTNDAGAYQLDGLAAGSYVVTASAPGGRPDREIVNVADDATLDFALPYARVAGVVVESGSQQPLPDALVQATTAGAPAPDGPPGRGATTDSNGRFSIDGLEPAAYVLSARKAGYQMESRSVSVSEGGGAEDVVLELVRGDGIGLEMRDAQLGVPVRAVQARVVDAQGAVAFAGGVPLDSDGRGEIPSLRPGSYALMLYAAGYAPAVAAASAPSPRVVVAMSPGGALEIHAGPATLASGTAHLQILTGDGRPYAFSFFSADGGFALSAPIRRLENLGPGSYLLEIEGGSPKGFEIAAGGLSVVTLP